MKLESQVCSLDLAKKLKALGVRRESAFYWNDEGSGMRLTQDDPDTYEWKENYSAFTVAELFKEHYDRFGVCDVPSKIEPDKLADHLAEKLCQKLSPRQLAVGTLEERVEAIALALSEARSEAIEEAAKVAEFGVEVWDTYPYTTKRNTADGEKIAQAIRQLNRGGKS